MWFAVLSMGRSGSTYLTRLLDSNDDIVCLGEAFGPGYDPPAYDPAAGVSRRNWLMQTLGGRPERARGFKLPMDGLLVHPALMGDLESLSARVVLLKRRNKLAHFVSQQLAQVNSQWSSGVTYPIQQVAIDPWKLVSFVISSNLQDLLLERVAAAFPYVTITYEELSDERRLNDVQSFLGVIPVRLQTDTVRTRTAALRDSIVNFDEVVRVLHSTPWAASVRHWAAADDLTTPGSPT